MKELNIENFTLNPYETIHKDWLLINSYNEKKVNTMTASWGGIGVIWNKPVLFLFIRPQRYTQELLSKIENFSVSVLGEKYRKELNYFGTASGRDEYKIKNSNLTIEKVDNIPIIGEGKLHFLLKKLYMGKIEEEGFIFEELINNNYESKDFHYVYIGEITKILEK